MPFNRIIIIPIVILLQFIILFCTDKPKDNQSDRIKYIIDISTDGKDWSVDTDGTGSLELSQDCKSPVFTGSILTFNFNSNINLRTLKLSRNNSLSEGKWIEFKLYLDYRYFGTFSEKQNIHISKEISSVTIIITHTGEEQLIHAWDNDFIYSMIRDTSKSGTSGLKLNFETDSALQQRYVMEHQKLDKKSGNPTTSPHWSHKPVIIIRKNKLDQIIDEYDTDFSRDENFKFNYRKADGITKNIISDLFFKGDVISAGNKDCILKGSISGTIKKKQLQDKKFDLNFRLNHFSLYHNSIIDEILFDLPDWVMVNASSLDSSLIVDMPYATENNITGKKLYPCNKCFLRYIVLKSLLQTNRVFRQKGFRVKLLDCYRPLDVQKLLYEICPVRGYVADPIGGSIHNRATAVDLTLTDMNGNKIEMGSEYDDFSSRSHFSYKNLPDTVIKRRKFLRETMKTFNFTPIMMEWWHFEFNEGRKYPKLNDPFPCSEISE